MGLQQEIREYILDELRQQLSLAFSASVEPIRKRLMDLCDGLVKGSPAYDSLINGELLGELGVPDIRTKMNGIIGIIKNSLQVGYQPIVKRGGNLTGGLIISILKADFQDILSAGEASYTTEKGTQINGLIGYSFKVIGLSFWDTMLYLQKR